MIGERFGSPLQFGHNYQGRGRSRWFHNTSVTVLGYIYHGVSSLPILLLTTTHVQLIVELRLYHASFLGHDN